MAEGQDLKQKLGSAPRPRSHDAEPRSQDIAHSKFTPIRQYTMNPEVDGIYRRDGADLSPGVDSTGQQGSIAVFGPLSLRGFRSSCFVVEFRHHPRDNLAPSRSRSAIASINASPDNIAAFPSLLSLLNIRFTRSRFDMSLLLVGNQFAVLRGL